MKLPTLLHKLTIPATLILVLGVTTQAQTIMLNFGNPSAVNRPDDAPYVAPDGNTWTNIGIGTNTINTANSIDIGNDLTLRLSLGGSGTINFTETKNINSSALGSNGNTGIYAIGGVAASGIFSSYGGDSTANQALGLQISGLAVGEYKIYLSGLNTNISAGSINYADTTFYLSTTAAAGATDINYTSFTTTGLQSLPTAAYASTAWEQNLNYVLLDFEITSATDVLTIVSKGTDQSERRGFLNTLQIIAIPEPTTCTLLISGGILLTLTIARRRQHHP
jgi:hypothetical protein